MRIKNWGKCSVRERVGVVWGSLPGRGGMGGGQGDLREGDVLEAPTQEGEETWGRWSQRGPPTPPVLLPTSGTRLGVSNKISLKLKRAKL